MNPAPRRPDIYESLSHYFSYYRPLKDSSFRLAQKIYVTGPLSFMKLIIWCICSKVVRRTWFTSTRTKMSP